MATKVTPEQRGAAKKVQQVARFNTDSIKAQLARALKNFDDADAQNRDLADVQLKQHSRRAADDRFGALKKLQSSVAGILGAGGEAMVGSGKDALASMVDTRQDLDTGEALSTLRVNQDSVRNALDEALNANYLARKGAISDALYGLRGIKADVATQLANMHPELFVAPEKVKKAGDPVDPKNPKYKPRRNDPRLSGYFVT